MAILRSPEIRQNTVEEKVQVAELFVIMLLEELVQPEATFGFVGDGFQIFWRSHVDFRDIGHRAGKLPVLVV